MKVLANFLAAKSANLIYFHNAPSKATIYYYTPIELFNNYLLFPIFSPYPCSKIPLIFLDFCEMYMLLNHSFVHPLAIYHLLIHLQLLINGRGGSVG